VEAFFGVTRVQEFVYVRVRAKMSVEVNGTRENFLRKRSICKVVAVSQPKCWRETTFAWERIFVDFIPVQKTLDTIQ